MAASLEDILGKIRFRRALFNRAAPEAIPPGKTKWLTTSTGEECIPPPTIYPYDPTICLERSHSFGGRG